MRRINFNIKDRKVLTLGLCLVVVCVFTLTIAYAALNAVLTIQGSAQVTSADWDIHLANPKVTNGSVTTTVPTLATGKSLTFSTTLNMPGDFYEFTVDVVNSGSIDAMIEKVTKTPELTADQAKYLNYEVSYQNGESITNKQAIAAGVTMPIKVRVEFRKDLSSTDLPTGQVQLTLGLVLDYVQSDGTGTSVPNNGVGGSNISANGSLDAIGTIVTIGDQQFYTIGTEGDNIKLLSMMNITLEDKPIQSSSAGITVFSRASYWSSNVSTYPAYIYDSNSKLYTYIENYKNVIEGMGVDVIEARPITYEELTSEEIGCSGDNNSCTSSPYSWIYSTMYWSGSAGGTGYVWGVGSGGSFGHDFGYSYGDGTGVRPVIIISKSLF